MAIPSEDQVQITEKSGKNRKKLLIVLLPVLAVCVIAGIAIGVATHQNGGVTAVLMRLERLVGTANLFDQNGKEQSIKEQMRLSSGQSLSTADDSLIVISLDETKLVTMEENSKAEIEASDNSLVFDLKEGNLFFNVTEKLAEGQIFDVKASTLVCGIRGTSAYVGIDSSGHEYLMVTDGTVRVVAENPITHEQVVVEVPPGQMITIYLDDEAEGGGTISVQMQPYKEEDLPPTALQTIVMSDDLLIRVVDATGLSGEKMTAFAELTSVAPENSDVAKDGKPVPLMGDEAFAITKAAKAAGDIAGDDLDTELAILKGLRGVLDAGEEDGIDGDDLLNLMDDATETMKKVCKEASSQGITGDGLLKVIDAASDVLKTNAKEEPGTGLSETEMKQIITAGTEGAGGAVQGQTTTPGGNEEQGGNNGDLNRLADAGNIGAGVTMQIPGNGVVIPGVLMPGETPSSTPAPVPAGSTTPADPTPSVDPTPPIGPTPTPAPGVYSVTLHPEGGIIRSGNITSYTQGIGAVLPTDVAKAPTEEYVFSFDGWYTEETGGTKVTAISATDTGNKEYYAHWSQTQAVKVTFYDGWDRINVLDTQTVAQGERPVYAGNTPTKAPDEYYTYTWNGWYDEYETEYAVGAPLPVAEGEEMSYYTSFSGTPRTYAITKAAMSNGSVSIKVDNTEVTEAKVGETVTLQVDANDHYELKTLSVKDAEGNTVSHTPDTSAEVSTYTFDMPVSPVTVSAEFQGQLYTIHITQGHGTGASDGVVEAYVNGQSVTSARYGDTVTMEVEPSAGCQLENNVINSYVGTMNDGILSKEMHLTDGMTVAMPAKDLYVNAYFELITYPLYWTSLNTSGVIDMSTVSVQTADGTGLSNGSQVAPGTEVIVTFQRNTNKTVGSVVLVDGQSQSLGITADLVLQEDNKTYCATFTMPSQYAMLWGNAGESAFNLTISASALTNGSVTPNSNTPVVDTTVTLTVTPDPSYHLKEDSLNVCDDAGNMITLTPVGSDEEQFTFTMPPSEVTVTAIFEQEV